MFIQKIQFIETYGKKVQFFESYFQKGSILWVIFLKWTMVQVYESWFKFYESMLKRRVQFLWVNVEKKGSISMSHVEKRVQYCESCWTEWKIQFFESCWTEGFNSLSHFEKRVSILWVKLKRWVQFSESYFSQSGSILGVIFQSVQCLELLLKKTLNHIQEKVQFFVSQSKNNIFESC